MLALAPARESLARGRPIGHHCAVGVRRWNGWIDEEAHGRRDPRRRARLLEAEIGAGRRRRDATLDEVVAGRAAVAPRGRRPRPRPTRAIASATPAARACPTGSRSGAAGSGASRTPSPARPTDDDVRRPARAGRDGRRDGHPVRRRDERRRRRDAGPPTTTGRSLTVATGRARRAARPRRARAASRRSAPERSGRTLEAALAPHGLTLGHFPQSFERSTLGGWVAARSAGQQSIGLRPDRGAVRRRPRSRRRPGPLDLPPHPASAAGPDLRQLVLGSEGRLGILTQATVRTVAEARARERSAPGSCPDWPRALDAARELARAGLPLSMVRALDADRDRDDARPGRRCRAGVRALARLPPAARRSGRSRASLLVGATRPRAARRGAGPRGRLDRRGGTAASRVGGSIGRHWLATAFRAPDLRDALWDAGYAVDTLETAADWTAAAGPRRGASAGRSATASTTDGERVHAFSHLSHVYPSGLEPVRDVRLPARRRPGRDARPLAPAQGGGERGDRRPTAGRSATSTASGATTRRTSRPRRASSGMAALGDVARRLRPGPAS